jgi:hypothetical protein
MLPPSSGLEEQSTQETSMKQVAMTFGGFMVPTISRQVLQQMCPSILTMLHLNNNTSYI